MKLLIFTFIFTASLVAQHVDMRRQGRNFDFSGSSFTRPVRVGDALPTTCSVGELFFWRSASSGSYLQGCTSTNTWTALSTASGSFNTNSLLDLKVTRNSASLLQIGATCSSAQPCRINIGNKPFAFTAPGSATISSGSGTVFFYVSSAGQLTAEYPSGGAFNLSCISLQCLSVSSPSFPAGSIPLASVPATGGQWQTSFSDMRTFLSSAPVVAGSGLSGSLANGILTLSISGDSIPALNGENSWQGVQDFSAASQMRIRTGAGNPTGSTCNSTQNVGGLYARSDTAGANASLYLCANTAPGSFSWELVQGGGGGSGGGSLEVQSDGSLIGARPRLNFLPGPGSVLVCSDDSVNNRVNCSVQIDTAHLNGNYARLGANNVYPAGFLHDFSAASMRLPATAAAAPQSSGYIAYDTNANELRMGRNGSTKALALKDSGTQPLVIFRPNQSGAGTANQLLAKLANTGEVTRAAVSDTNGVVGIVVSGGGSSGTAEIATTGVAVCIADNNSAIGNYVIIGSAVAGRCRDAGSSYPANGQVLGRWLSAVSTGQSGNVLLFGTGQQSNGSGGTASQSLSILLTNEPATGTLSDHLVKLDNLGRGIRAAADDVRGVVGIASANAGQSGQVTVISAGIANCVADNSTTAGNYAIIGISTAGRCRDAGSGYPLSGQVIGRWLSSVGASGTGSILLFGPGIEASAGGGGGASIVLLSLSNQSLGGYASGDYFSPSSSSKGTEAERTWLITKTGTARNFFLRTTTAQGSENGFQCWLRKNGSDTALSIFVASSSAAGVFSNTGSVANLSAGDTLTIRCQNYSSASSAVIGQMSLEVY